MGQPVAPAILVTGAPGTGKTTLVSRIASCLGSLRVRGFVTREVREGGRRRGFRVVTLAGVEGRLAESGFSSLHRVGRYGVDLEGFERVALGELEPREDVDLYIVDEIGKMECLSSRFIARVRDLLDTRCPLLATVALRGGGFIAEVKSRSGVELLELTRGNRDELPARILERISRRRSGA